MDGQFPVGSRVSARGLAWDVIDVAALGTQTLLRLRCAGGDLLGLEWDILHPAERVALLRAELRPDAPGPLSGWRLLHQACLLEQVPGPDDMMMAEPGRLRVEFVSAGALAARTRNAAAASAARGRRGSGQDDRGGADRVRADRTPAGAPRAGDLACGTAADAMVAGDAAALRPALHRRCRCRRAARAAAPAGTRRQSVRCHRAVPDVAGFRQAGARAGGTGAIGVGPGDRRRGASLHRQCGGRRSRTRRSADAWRRWWHAAATGCCC